MLPPDTRPPGGRGRGCGDRTIREVRERSQGAPGEVNQWGTGVKQQY